MTLKSRLDRLLSRAGVFLASRARASHRTRLKGASWQVILDAFAAALPQTEEAEALLDLLVEQVEEQARNRVRTLPDGTQSDYDQRHGIFDWFADLREGRTALPEQIPLVWLRAWCDGFWRTPDWGEWPLHDPSGEPREPSGPIGTTAVSPRPLWRCEGCSFGLPHCPTVIHWDACPSCGSNDLSFVELSGSGHYRRRRDSRRVTVDGEVIPG